MPADRKALFARLDALGIAHTTVEHEAVFTVEQSQGLLDTLPGAHTKNLFLTDKDGRALLVVAEDKTAVDLRRVARQLGFGRLSFGKPERLMELLGVTPGRGLLRMNCVTTGADGIAISLETSMYHPDRYRFRAILHKRTKRWT